MLRSIWLVALVGILALLSGHEARVIPREQIHETSQVGTLTDRGRPTNQLVLGVKGPGETPVKSSLDNSWYDNIYGDKVGWNPWGAVQKKANGGRYWNN